jgi:Uncharacterized conserved protein
MEAILVFIDGTTCDMRHRIPLQGTDKFFSEEYIMMDIPTEGSVECMNELSQKYILIYIGARPSDYVEITKNWYRNVGFPESELYLGKNQQERMDIVRSLKMKYVFHAGIGDRFDDNELHLELGCMSFILQEWKPNWDTVRKYIK